MYHHFIFVWQEFTYYFQWSFLFAKCWFTFTPNRRFRYSHTLCHVPKRLLILPFSIAFFCSFRENTKVLLKSTIYPGVPKKCTQAYWVAFKQYDVIKENVHTLLTKCLITCVQHFKCVKLVVFHLSYEHEKIALSNLASCTNRQCTTM